MKANLPNILPSNTYPLVEGSQCDATRNKTNFEYDANEGLAPEEESKRSSEYSYGVSSAETNDGLLTSSNLPQLESGYCDNIKAVVPLEFSNFKKQKCDYYSKSLCLNENVENSRVVNNINQDCATLTDPCGEKVDMWKHNYAIREVSQWHPHMLSPAKVREIREQSRKMVNLPKTTETGIHFNRNRPSWAVTYWENGTRKYRHFFVPDLSSNTIRMVLSAAVKLRHMIESEKLSNWKLPPPGCGGYGMLGGDYSFVQERDKPCHLSSFKQQRGYKHTSPSNGEAKTPKSDRIELALPVGSSAACVLPTLLPSNVGEGEKVPIDSLPSLQWQWNSFKGKIRSPGSGSTCLPSTRFETESLDSSRESSSKPFVHTERCKRPTHSESASRAGVTTRRKNTLLQEVAQCQYNWLHASNHSLAVQWEQALAQDLHVRSGLVSNNKESALKDWPKDGLQNDKKYLVSDDVYRSECVKDALFTSENADTIYLSDFMKEQPIDESCATGKQYGYLRMQDDTESISRDDVSTGITFSPFVEGMDLEGTEGDETEAGAYSACDPTALAELLPFGTHVPNDTCLSTVLVDEGVCNRKDVRKSLIVDRTDTNDSAFQDFSAFYPLPNNCCCGQQAMLDMPYDPTLSPVKLKKTDGATPFVDARAKALCLDAALWTSPAISTTFDSKPFHIHACKCKQKENAIQLRPLSNGIETPTGAIGTSKPIRNLTQSSPAAAELNEVDMEYLRNSVGIYWDCDENALIAIWFIGGKWQSRVFPCETVGERGILAARVAAEAFFEELKGIAKAIQNCIANQKDPQELFQILFSKGKISDAPPLEGRMKAYFPY